MWIPPQGFRHAATLLLTNGARKLAPDLSPAEALQELAEELVALARDTHADPRVADWMRAEYEVTVDRLVPTLRAETEVVERIKADAARIFGTLEIPQATQKDLFLIYVPEDRLPVAAPLAIELEKRRVTVAFSDFEIASQDQISSAITIGLTRHRAGALVWTPSARRVLGDLDVAALIDEPDRPRFRLVDITDQLSIADDLAAWSRRLASPPAPLS